MAVTKQNEVRGRVKKLPRRMPDIERSRVGEGSRVGVFCPDLPYPRLQLCPRPKSIGVRSYRSRVTMNNWIYQPGAKADSKLRNQSDDSLPVSNTRTGSSLVLVENCPNDGGNLKT